MRRILRWFLALVPFAVFLAPAVAAPADSQSTPTNLIAIVTDDQGRWAMGAYDNDEIHTPNMDRIAREGALFTNAFVATPVCSPSRATYFTGLWATQVHITDWLSPEETDEGAGLKAQTWAHALQQHGYRTALFGKWHLGTAPEFHPTKKGFDHFVGFLEGGTKPMNPVLEIDSETSVRKGSLPDILVDHAIRYITANRDEPFAVCLHFRAPHRPYAPVPTEDSAPYDSLNPTVPEAHGVDVNQVKDLTRAYYASVSSVDRNIGRLLAALDDLKLTERTLVTFTSDHGYNEGRHGIDTKGNGHWIAGGVRGPKRPNMWETSIRVPLAVRWPGVVEPGTRIDHTVTTLDMYRTVLGALNVPVPENCPAQGVDFSPVLRGRSLPEPEAVFGQYDLHNGGLAYLRMIRTPQYKFIRHYKARMMDELYDLKADPSEERNLLNRRGTGKWQVVADGLNERLVEWQRSIDDPVLGSGY